MGDVQPYVVQSDVTVEGLNMPKGTVVDLDIDSDLAAAYGGTGNLQPLPAGETGDDAGHAALGN